jgi:transcriptional regulator with XRE-family HTH domain
MSVVATDLLGSIQHELDERGMSQADVGDALGTSQTYWSRRLIGRVPMRLADIEALAELLDLDVRIELTPRERD